MFTKKNRIGVMLLILVLLLVVMVGTALAGAQPSQSSVYWFADESEVSGANAQVVRKSDSINFHINTKDLGAGHIFTVWSVTFNASQNCSDGVCGEDDIFLSPGVLNLPQIAAADISVIYAGGFQANANGIGNVNGTIHEGLPGTAGQFHKAPFSTTGLGSAQESEVHLIVRDHGPAQAGLAYAQISSFGGGCNNVPAGHPGWAGNDGDFACEDVQFAVFVP